MTEERPRYVFPGPVRFLDPCIKPVHFPRQLELIAPEPGRLSEARRQAAARVLEDVRLEIVRRLRWEPRCYDEGGRRRVHLWSSVEISVASDGTDFRSRFLEGEPDAGRFIATADLTRPIGGFAFSVAFMPVLCQYSREGKLDPRVIAGPTGDWMRNVIRRTYRRYVDWNRLRRSVLAFLRPDTLVYSLARRTFEDVHPTVDAFNWVARHQRELAQVAIDRPALLPFLQLVSRVEAGFPLDNFERVIAEAGITPSARRKLERWGWVPFSQACDYAVFAGGVETIAGYANLLDRLQVVEAPPIMFTELAAHPGESYAPDWYLRALLAEIERLEEDLPDDPYPLEFPDAQAWIASGPREPDENQRRAGWPWIVEQAWKHKLATDASARQPWPAVPGEMFSIGAHRIAPLTNLVELREEGKAMRNCLASMADQCAAGKVAVFSIRDDTGRRVASFSLARVKGDAPFWQVLQVAGKENSEVEPAIQKVAVLAAARLNSASS